MKNLVWWVTADSTLWMIAGEQIATKGALFWVAYILAFALQVYTAAVLFRVRRVSK